MASIDQIDFACVSANNKLLVLVFNFGRVQYMYLCPLREQSTILVVLFYYNVNLPVSELRNNGILSG